MSKLIADLIKDFPEIIDSPILMNNPNEPIEIFKGEFKLKFENLELIVDGILLFEWFPKLGPIFKGTLISQLKDSINLLSDFNYFQLEINDLDVGETFITNITHSTSSDKPKISGVFTRKSVFGDYSIPVDSIKFCIPNLKDFFGSGTYRKTGKSISTSLSRLSFENDNYTINIDKTIDYKDRLEKLKSKGGYLILYSGELKLKKGDISLKDVQDFSPYFNLFLNFINGSRVSACFYTGIFESEKIWTDYSNYSIEIHNNPISWTPVRSINGFNDIFRKFSDLWKNEDDSNFLISAIHWYIEANNNSGFTEGAIIMAQTALELIYNWLIIEKKGLIIGKDAESISAANKIRLLISHLNISYNAPESFDKLQEYIDTNNDIADAPEAIVQIRNAIIHSQLEKRKKITKLNYQTKYEALQLSIWYIELSMLNILGYTGIYSNRCSRESFPKNREQNVPWL